MFSTPISCAFIVERFIKVWIWVVICILLVAKKREVFVISLLEVFILQSFGFVQRVDSSMAFSFDTPPLYLYNKKAKWL